MGGVQDTEVYGHTLLVPVRFHVPVRVDVAGLVLFDAADFDLFEAPLGKVDVSGA